MQYQTISLGADALAQWAAIALGFSIPVSVALDNVLLLVILLAWIIGANYRAKLSAVLRNPVALAALALFGALLLGTAYGSAPADDKFGYLGKYGDLVFVALLLPAFQAENTRRRARAAFAGSLLLTLVVSYAIAFGVLPPGLPGLAGSAANPTAFKGSITHNLLLAYGAFLFACMARREAIPSKRAAYWIVTALMAGSVLFFGVGRTGYLVLAALLAYFCWDWLRWKGLLVAALIGGLLGTAAYFGSPALHQRVTETAQEYSGWQPGKAESSSIGLRLEFYHNTLGIIRDHPLLGVGTGGFATAYAAKVQGSGMEATRNPHNEYLMIAVQLGIAGLLLLFYLFYAHWRYAPLLAAPPEALLARGALLTIASGCLANALLIDHAEGLFYAWSVALFCSGRRQ